VLIWDEISGDGPGAGLMRHWVGGRRQRGDCCAATNPGVVDGDHESVENGRDEDAPPSVWSTTASASSSHRSSAPASRSSRFGTPPTLATRDGTRRSDFEAMRQSAPIWRARQHYRSAGKAVAKDAPQSVQLFRCGRKPQLSDGDASRRCETLPNRRQRQSAQDRLGLPLRRFRCLLRGRLHRRVADCRASGSPRPTRRPSMSDAFPVR
jgi:hypothetical protein